MSNHDHESVAPILDYTNRGPLAFIGRRPRPEGRKGEEVKQKRRGRGVKIPHIRNSRQNAVISREVERDLFREGGGRSHSVIAEQSKNMYVSDDASERAMPPPPPPPPRPVGRRTDAVVELFGLVPSLRYRLLAREGRRPRRRRRPPPPPSTSGGSSRVVPRSNAAKKVERGGEERSGVGGKSTSSAR